MSSKKLEKGKLKVNSDFEREKTRILYRRLKSIYNLTGDELGEELAGISKQAIYKREKSGKYNPDEIISAFPDVNKKWLFSENVEDLERLPVRRSNDLGVSDADSVDLSKGGLSDQSKKELLEQIESIARILRDSL